MYQLATCCSRDHMINSFKKEKYTHTLYSALLWLLDLLFYYHSIQIAPLLYMHQRLCSTSIRILAQSLHVLENTLKRYNLVALISSPYYSSSTSDHVPLSNEAVYNKYKCSYSHGVEQLTVLIITLIFTHKDVQLINQLCFNLQHQNSA